MQTITPCLWFDSNAEEAAKFYTSIFKNSKIKRMSRYGKEGYEIHGKPEGSVLTVEFELNGQTFTALNGGPVFKFNEAISFQVPCESQSEVDYYWEKLSQGGDETAQQWDKLSLRSSKRRVSRFPLGERPRRPVLVILHEPANYLRSHRRQPAPAALASESR
jgi:predicted 3-demethylubiquinone-9 3-methyltransferase (glyoxalase superfamily)